MAEAPGGSWLSHQDTLTNFIVCLVVFHLLAVVRFPRGGLARFCRHAGRLHLGA